MRKSRTVRIIYNNEISYNYTNSDNYINLSLENMILYIYI